jgi:hypothetical protein
MVMNTRRKARDWSCVDAKFSAKIFGLDSLSVMFDRDAPLWARLTLYPGKVYATCQRYLLLSAALSRRIKTNRSDTSKVILPIVLNISAKTCTVLNRPCKL